MSAEFTSKTRTAVLIRAGHQCERCGNTVGLQFHHRRPRAAGGTKDPAAATAANALVLCHICHGWVERNRDKAADAGWLVRQGVDPATVPTVTFNGGHVLLGTDGKYYPTRRGASGWLGRPR